MTMLDRPLERPLKRPLVSAVGLDGADEATEWIRVCDTGAITEGLGVCVLLDGAQIAVFRTSATRQLYALGNLDPFSGASVLSRGILGSARGVDVVASPMYKHRFELATGASLDDPTVVVPTYPVRERDGLVELVRPGGCATPCG